jgi:D-sedoheptulose 7-phosphate isomerase
MLNDLIERHPALAECKDDILAALDVMIGCYERGGKLLLCGNGGSAADCDHIVGELMKDFLVKRPIGDKMRAVMRERCPHIEERVFEQLQLGLPAISLPSITGFNTAFSNDRDPELVYAQGVLSLAGESDVLIAISTSGNAKNVLNAAKVAKGLGLSVVALTGNSGGDLRSLADVCVRVPERETYKVQELHLCVYHYLCAAIEHHFFSR